MSIPDVLLASVQRGYIEDVRVMFKDQYMLVQDEMGNTLLHIAAGSGHAEVVQFLLAQKGSNKALQMKNHIGDTPLHRAAFRGHVAVCKVLIGTEMCSANAHADVAGCWCRPCC